MNEQVEATILVVDLAGTHRLLEQMGQGPANRLIGRLLGGIGQTIEYYGGSVIRTIGDEVTADFVRPDPAIATAIHVQREMSRHREASRYGLSVRIGLHHGLITHSAKDVFGPALQAARAVTALAKREQILLSQILASWSGIQTPVVDFGRHQIVGIESEIDVVAVDWRHAVADDLRRAAGRATQSEDHGLELSAGVQVAACTATNPVVEIGRKPSANIILSYPWVSREHLRLERSSDGYVLTDNSRNGTWVYMELSNPEAGTDRNLSAEANQVAEASEPEWGVDGAAPASDSIEPDRTTSAPQPAPQEHPEGHLIGDLPAGEAASGATRNLPDTDAPGADVPDAGLPSADPTSAAMSTGDAPTTDPAEDAGATSNLVERHIRGESITLIGRGWIGVGRSDTTPETLIAYGPPASEEDRSDTR
jgi:class 3 adenylate cyclase